MESNRKFTLIVFNTCTQEYEEVIVTEEVYRAYCRTRWNIKDNDQSFFDHEIQTSGMIGSQDGAYENFREFIDAINTPEHIILEQIKKEALYQAISALPAADQMWTLVSIAVEFSLQSGHLTIRSFLKTLASVFKNPLIIAIFCGVAWSFTGLSI